MYAKEEDLRTLRENVLLVVRDYNRILAALNTEERGLFKVCSSVYIRSNEVLPECTNKQVALFRSDEGKNLSIKTAISEANVITFSTFQY